MPTEGPTLEAIDTFEGARCIKEGIHIRELVRPAYVRGLGRIGSGSASAFHNDALMCPGLPKAWDPHPAPGLSMMRAVAWEVEALSGDRARVMIHYRNAALRVIRGGSVLKTFQTNKDRQGNRLLVSHNGAAGTEYCPEVTVTDPLGVYVCSKIEPSPRYYGPDPTKHVNDYINRVNSQVWRLGNPGTWLCENVTFDDSGMTEVAYEYTWEFRYDKNGWKPEVDWVDPETGNSPTGLQLGTGYILVDHYDSADFGPLSLEPIWR
jgi:hypothetical protein